MSDLVPSCVSSWAGWHRMVLHWGALVPGALGTALGLKSPCSWRGCGGSRQRPRDLEEQLWAEGLAQKPGCWGLRDARAAPACDQSSAVWWAPHQYRDALITSFPVRRRPFLLVIPPSCFGIRFFFKMVLQDFLQVIISP